MKMSDVQRTYYAARAKVWPPIVVSGAGMDFVARGEGILKAVRRTGDVLSVTIMYDRGDEAHAALMCDDATTLAAVEHVLRTSVGKTVAEVGELEV